MRHFATSAEAWAYIQSSAWTCEKCGIENEEGPRIRYCSGLAYCSDGRHPEHLIVECQVCGWSYSAPTMQEQVRDAARPSGHEERPGPGWHPSTIETQLPGDRRNGRSLESVFQWLTLDCPFSPVLKRRECDCCLRDGLALARMGSPEA